MSKLRFLVENFPNADWNSEWYSGQFFSENSFPPLFHYVGGALVAWLGLSYANALIVLAAVSFVAIVCGIYGFVRVITRSRLAALLAALLLISTGAFWSYILVGGLYPRILGMAFLSAFAFFHVLYAKSRSRLAWFAAVLSLAGALSTHLLLGAIGVALAALLVVAEPGTTRRRVIDAVGLLVPTAFVVAYFYLPYVASLGRPTPVPLLTSEYTPSPMGALFGTSSIDSLPIFLLPAVIAAVVVFAIRRARPMDGGGRLVPVLLIASAAAIAYAIIGLPEPHRFIYNFQPYQALFFAAFFLSALAGIAVGGLRLPSPALVAAALVILGFVAVFPARFSSGVVNADNRTKAQLQSELHVDPSDRQHRVGVSWDSGSDWIDARFDVPQTRGYQQQGVINADWQYWLESRVWSADSSYGETNFLLDWYAVQSFYAGPDANVAKRFAARPDLYAPQDATMQTFDYRAATQIMAATSTTSALVIGSDAAYSSVLRALSFADVDSRAVIPVRGGELVDDLSLAELDQFDVVVLYDYAAHDLSRSFELLLQYVEGGGALYVEANNSPFATSQHAPAPLPGTAIDSAAVGPDWDLAGSGSPITQGVELAAFAPAVYAGGPWGVSYMPPDSLRSSAQVVLTTGGRPLVVTNTLGRGRVVWSGMNLPYHAASTGNEVESRMLGNMLAWAAPPPPATPTFSAQFVNPELRRVDVTSPARGVLLKESRVPNWQATVDGSPTQIYAAGPDFMYVPLRGPGTVVFAFTRTSLEWAGDAISTVALVALIAWPAAGWWRRRRLSRPTPPTR